MFTKKISSGTLIVVVFIAAISMLVACGESKTGDATNGKQLWTCGMHPQVIQEEPGNCPICGMKLTPLKPETMADTEREHETTHDSLRASDMEMANGKQDRAMASIRIDPVTVQNMGVRTAEVKRQPFYRQIRTVGHVDYNEDELYNINVKFPGWIEELHVEREGEPVRKGQALFNVYSPELVATQEEYLLAYKNSERLSASDIKTVSSGAERLLKSARKRLEYWDITGAQIERLQQTGEIQKTLTIYSPANGVVIEKNAVEGAYVKGGEKLFQIADLSTVWVLAHIFEYELPWIELGQTVKMELPYVPGRQFEGKIDYVYPYLNAKTRDIRIRLVFENPTMELKPEMYANIVIESKLGDDVLVIPSEAVIRTGTRNLVFIALGNGKFRPQEVTLGPEGEDGLVKVVEGVQEGEQIVTSAQFLLDSESRLREAVQKMMETKTRNGAKEEEMSKQMQGHQH